MKDRGMPDPDPLTSGQGEIRPFGPAWAIEIDGKTFPIPAGGSDTTTAGQESLGQGEPVDPADLSTAAEEDGQGQGAQPDDDGGGQQSSGGQEFIEPYLEGLDPRIRPQVEERLEQFRADQDAQVQKKIENVNSELRGFKEYASSPEELEVPIAFYQSIVNDPLNTIEWLFDRFDQELGRDLRSEVQQMVMPNGGQTSQEGNQPQPATDGQQLAQGQPTQQGQQDGQQQDPANQPMTKADVEAYFEQKRQEEQQAQQQRQQEEQQRQQVQGWVDEAAKRYSLPLEQDDPLRETIVAEAGKLFEQGQVTDGQQAVEMATESLMTKLRNKVGGQQSPPQQLTTPKIANGGQAPGQQKPDLSDPKARQSYMEALLTGGGSQ